MNTSTTSDICVAVESFYSPDESKIIGKPFFTYKISIKNLSSRTVQLLYRKWDIVDSFGERREIFGPGVVGEQPVLNPGDEFTYSSGCDFLSGLGRMQGEYIFREVSTNRTFPVKIPTFILIQPAILN